MDDGSPTADSGYIQQGTTGGDAADTFNIRNHVGADDAPAILMSPPSGAASSLPTTAVQKPLTPATAKPVSAAQTSAGAGKPAVSSAKPSQTKTSAPAAKAGGAASSAKAPVEPTTKPTGTKV